MPIQQCWFTLLALSMFPLTPSAAESMSSAIVLGDYRSLEKEWESLFPEHDVTVSPVSDFSLQQLGWNLEEEVLTPKPDACLLLGGTIDALIGVPPETTGKVASGMADRLRETGIEALVSLVPPLPASFREANRAIARTNEVFRQLASDGKFRIVDPYSSSPPREPDFARIAGQRIQRILAEAGPRDQIVMLGDSITEQGGDWTARLGQPSVRNVGQGGYTTGQIQWLLEPCVFPAQPHLCFVLAGINDLSLGIPTGKIISNYTEILDAIRERKIQPVVQSTLYPRNSPDVRNSIRLINNALRDYCQRYRIPFLDLNPVLGDEDGLLAQYTTDNTHLTEAGYRKWAAFLRGFLSGYYANNEPTSPGRAR